LVSISGDTSVNALKKARKTGMFCVKYTDGSSCSINLHNVRFKFLDHQETNDGGEISSCNLVSSNRKRGRPSKLQKLQDNTQ
jgi:hypothetical protein